VRTVTLFNDQWLYTPTAASDNTPDSVFEPITLPHTNKLLPHHNFDNAEYQFISTYRKRFTLPEPRQGRRVYLDFDGVMIACSVGINGHKLGENDGGYTPFSYDITDYLQDGENLLTVQVDSTERPDIPPYGYVVDYLTFGGIYRDVWLRMVPPCHIIGIFVKPRDVLDDPKLDVEVTLKNQSSEPARVFASVTLDLAYDARTTKEMYTGVRGQTVDIPANGESRVTIHYAVLPDMELWTLENPALHSLRVALQPDNQNTITDEKSARFGLREARFKEDGFYLNGERLQLIGLNRHQTFPYIGAAAPARLQRKDAEILKHELGVNIVRTSHYPQSPHFLKRCDEIGLLVLEEIPGWQFIGDSDWKALTLRDVQAMIERDRNHPSIILWGVRINESWDDEAFYKATNELAHKLDPTRQTGGIRNFRESQLLEDVFTFNDFSRGVLEPNHAPYMITEFNGHMFPTKSWDQEERAVEHALRHARIQDAQSGTKNMAGAIGWCAFDYNTHRDFGSGDRICYHGVMDMFRLPKFAAAVYESQISPSVRPVLRVAGLWTPGDRSEGGNDPLWVFSNCEEVEMYIGDTSEGRFKPSRGEFPHLPYAPTKIPGISQMATWGKHYQDLRIVGYIGGKAVVEQTIEAAGLPRALTLVADDAELKADGADMTRLSFRIVDKYGNRLPYTQSVVTFEVEGPAELIGENPFPLMGGQAALYLKARHTSGVVTVTASTARLAPVTVKVTLK